LSRSFCCTLVGSCLHEPIETSQSGARRVFKTSLQLQHLPNTLLNNFGRHNGWHPKLAVLGRDSHFQSHGPLHMRSSAEAKDK
jgi:hypothetical protein